MLRNFYRYLADLTADRTDEIVNDVAANGRAYRHFTPQIIKVLDSIKAALPLEYRGLLEELSDLQGKRELIVFKALYRQGVKDGVQLCNHFQRKQFKRK